MLSTVQNVIYASSHSQATRNRIKAKVVRTRIVAGSTTTLKHAYRKLRFPGCQRRFALLGAFRLSALNREVPGVVVFLKTKEAAAVTARGSSVVVVGALDNPLSFSFPNAVGVQSASSEEQMLTVLDDEPKNRSIPNECDHDLLSPDVSGYLTSRTWMAILSASKHDIAIIYITTKRAIMERA